MKTKVVVAWISAGASIIVAVIGGFSFGKSSEQKYIQNQFDLVAGTVNNVIGDNNQIIINDIDSLVDGYIQLSYDYNELQKEKDDFVNEITQLSKDINQAYKLMNSKEEQANKEIDDLKIQLNNIPFIDYRNLGLCIDVCDIPINSTKSAITVDGRDYFSKEILEKVITEDKNLSIKNDTIYIGKVVEEKANLFDMNVMDSSGVEFMTTVKDSYNNNHSDALCIHTGNWETKHIIFTLDKKYTLLKLSVAIRDNAKITSTGVLVIRADDLVVYTSDILNKETNPYTPPEIPINNCDRLTIEYTPNPYSIDCIIYDAIVYN